MTITEIMQNCYEGKLMVSEQPWKCPRCKKWHSPTSTKCDCKPIQRDYCYDCLSHAFAVFSLPFPDFELIEKLAEDFHKNYEHRN